MGVQSKADKFKDSTASDLIPPTTLGVGKKGFGGAINKVQSQGSFTEGETTYGTPTALGVGKQNMDAPIQGTTGYGGMVNKVQKIGTYKEGETTYGTPIAEGELAQGGSNIPNPNPNGDLQERDANKGVQQGNEAVSTTQSQDGQPLTFFQKNKMPILIGGGVAVVAAIGLIAFSVIGSNK